MRRAGFLEPAGDSSVRAAKALGPGRREVDSAASFVRAANDGRFSLSVSLLVSEDDLCPADHCTMLLRPHMGACLRKHFKSQLAWRAASLRAVSGCHRFGAACLKSACEGLVQCLGKMVSCLFFF